MMRKIFEMAAATVLAAAAIAAVTHWSATRLDSAAVWSHAQSWATGHERTSWLVAVSIFGLNFAWWIVCATVRRRRDVDIFVGELTMPSLTSVLFTALAISAATSLGLHLAAAHSLWAFLPSIVAAWLLARAATAARHRWDRLTGML